MNLRRQVLAIAAVQRPDPGRCFVMRWSYFTQEKLVMQEKLVYQGGKSFPRQTMDEKKPPGGGLVRQRYWLRYLALTSMAVVVARLVVVMTSIPISSSGVRHCNERHKCHENQCDDLFHFDLLPGAAGCCRTAEFVKFVRRV